MKAIFRRPTIKQKDKTQQQWMVMKLNVIKGINGGLVLWSIWTIFLPVFVSPTTHISVSLILPGRKRSLLLYAFFVCRLLPPKPKTKKPSVSIPRGTATKRRWRFPHTHAHNVLTIRLPSLGRKWDLSRTQAAPGLVCMCVCVYARCVICSPLGVKTSFAGRF